MSDKVYNLLFVCTHNSARSIMTEALLNDTSGDRFRGLSAGSHPGGEVKPLGLATFAKMRIPTDGYRSNDRAEFAHPDAPEMDFVFTL